MKDFTPGEIAPGLTFIGNPAVLLYLVQGQQSCLIDAGMTAMGPLVHRHLDEYLGDVRRLDRHLLTHSHYDHVGCTPLLRRDVPDLQIGAHPDLAEIVARPNAVALIRKLNETVTGGPPPADAPHMLAFETFTVDERLEDETVIDLGGVEIHVLYTPGHTRDSVTYYIPHAKAVVLGEAAGVPDMQDRIMPEFLQSYECYMASLDRLSRLEIDVVCLPHNYVLTGAPAGRYIGNSIAASHEFQQRILQTLNDSNGDVEAAIETLFTAMYSPGHGQPKDAFTLNLQAMVKTVAKECI